MSYTQLEYLAPTKTIIINQKIYSINLEKKKFSPHDSCLRVRLKCKLIKIYFLFKINYFLIF